MDLTWILVISFLGGIHGFSRNPPSFVCLAPVPHHHPDKDFSKMAIEPQTTSAEVTITVSSTSYLLPPASSRDINITILSTAKPFKGFFLVVQRETGDTHQPVGKLHSCTGGALKEHSYFPEKTGDINCISHQTSDVKSLISCLWTPPESDQGPVKVFLTIVRAYASIWYGITQRIASPGNKQLTSLVTQRSASVTLSGCGQSKSCILFPRMCEMSDSCTAAVTYKLKSANEVEIEVTAPGSEWISVGISKDQVMADDHIITCFKDSNTGKFDMQLAYSTGKPNPTVYVLNKNVTARMVGESMNIHGQKHISCSFVVPVDFPINYPGKNVNFNLKTEKLYVFLARGIMYKGTRAYQKHGRIPLISTEAVMLADTKYKMGWFDGIQTKVKVHGTLMTLAWLFFSSIGVMLSRHYRGNLTKQVSGTALWFWFHVLCMVLAVLVAIAGFIYILVVNMGWLEYATVHGALGIVCLILALTNVGAGICRPHPTAEKRYIFDWFHCICGLLTRIFAIIAFWLAMRVRILNDSFEYYGTVVIAVWTSIEIFFFFVFAIRKYVSFKAYENEFEYRSQIGYQGMKKQAADVRHIGYKSFLFYTFLIVVLTVCLIAGLWIF